MSFQRSRGHEPGPIPIALYNDEAMTSSSGYLYMLTVYFDFPVLTQHSKVQSMCLGSCVAESHF